MLEYGWFAGLCLSSVDSRCFSYDISTQHICAFLDSFSIIVIAEGRGKFHLLNIRSLCNIYYRYIFFFECQRKEWWKEIIFMNYLLQIQIWGHMLVPTPSEFILDTFIFWIFCVCLYSQRLLLCYNFSFSLFLCCLECLHLLFSSFVLQISFVWYSKVHPCGDPWHDSIISGVLFYGWVIVPGKYVPILFNL